MDGPISKGAYITRILRYIENTPHGQPFPVRYEENSLKKNEINYITGS